MRATPPFNKKLEARLLLFTVHLAPEDLKKGLGALKKECGRCDVNPKTVAKRQKRTQMHNTPIGLKQPRSTVLRQEEAVLIVGFRTHTLLPLDDCLSALQATLPPLPRSALHCCLTQQDINRLPDIAGDQPTTQQFKPYPIGDFPIDSAAERTEEGQLSLFMAIDRALEVRLGRAAHRRHHNA